MKKIFFSMLIAGIIIPATSNAQLQKGNYLVGGDLANLNLDLSSGGSFRAILNPKVAWFIKDNVALGAYVNFGLSTSKGSKTSTDYGVGALGRYYINDPKTNVLQHGCLFFEGNVGIQGHSEPNGANTTGLGLGVGPGYAYFITPEIGLETLLKYNGIVGFGSQPYASAVSLNIGFQIYLSKSKTHEIINEVK